jgi:hypothetical protein
LFATEPLKKAKAAAGLDRQRKQEQQPARRIPTCYEQRLARCSHRSQPRFAPFQRVMRPTICDLLESVPGFANGVEVTEDHHRWGTWVRSMLSF